MIKILKVIWVTICFIVIVLYLLSCFTFCIPPNTFSYISLLAILFPYLLIAAVICCITLLFFNKRPVLALFIIVLITGIKNIGNSFAFNKGGWVMPKTQGALRIMTWNVEEFVAIVKNGPRAKPRSEMMDAINLYKPDILCVQEYRDMQNSRWAASVKKELDSLGFIFSFVSNDSVLVQKERSQDAVIFCGSAIFSRTPFLDSGRINIHNRVHNENAVYADIEFNSRKLRFFTAHLSSFFLYSDTTDGKSKGNIYSITYRRKRNVQYKIRENEILHESEAKILRSAMDNSPNPVIYCGDINSTPASYTYNKLRGNLQDAFLQKGSGIGVTFYKLLQNLRIDVCLADKSLAIRQCTVPQLYLSDHFPVVTDITWK